MRIMYGIMRYNDPNWAKEQERGNVHFCYIGSQMWYFVEETNEEQGVFLNTWMGTCLGKAVPLDLCASERQTLKKKKLRTHFWVGGPSVKMVQVRK